MRRLSVAMLLAIALLAAIPSSAQTTTTMTGSYTGWTAGPGIYWTHDGSQYTGDGSPGVMFSLSESLAGTLVDITIEDDLETHGVAELGGSYRFYGEPEPLPLPLGISGPIPVLSSGEFCGTAGSLPVPAGATTLQIVGNLTSCQVPHPGTSGEVTVTFRLP